MGESAVYSNKYFWNQTFATGVRDIIQGVYKFGDSDGINPLKAAFAKDIQTVIFPNTLDWLTKTDSPYRQSFKPDDFTDALKATWRRKAHAMFGEGDQVEGYPIIVDLWGTPLESLPEGTVYSALPLGRGKKATWQETEAGKIEFWDRFMANTFNVVKLKKSGAIADPYSAEVYRLWRGTRTNDPVPPMSSNRITVDGKMYKLNRDQYAYLSVLTGRYRLDGTVEHTPAGPRGIMKRRRGVRQFINSEEYEPMSTDDKIKGLKKIYSAARTQATKDFVGWSRDMDTKEVDLIMKRFNINPKNIPLTEDQIIGKPSGRDRELAE